MQASLTFDEQIKQNGLQYYSEHKAISQWFDKYINWRYFNGDKPKGLLLSGSSGSGKTTLAKCIMQSARKFSDDNSKFVYMRAQAILNSLERNDGQFETDMASFGNSEIIVDDIGRENNRKTYGKILDLSELYENRYLRYCSNKALTIFTTNIRYPTEIAERYARSDDSDYGRSIAGKICGMCDLVICSHKDQRIENCKPLNGN